jgi:carboxyl-terminal processing protease
VGTATYGKGVGQFVMSLSDGSMVKLSTFYFLTPDKRSVNEVGVKPDYVVQAPPNAQAEAMLSKYLSFAPMSENLKPAVGAVGLNVYGAQQRLELLGYDVSATGTMDQATADEVARFQKGAGLYAYGVLDFSTMAKLEEACVGLLTGAEAGTDAQLAKAVEILSQEFENTINY